MEQVIYSIGTGPKVKSYSQAGQDYFAWDKCGRISNGTFLDIGCNDPFVHNNTAALEEIGWTGVSVDIEKFDYTHRKCLFVQADARQLIPQVEAFVKKHNRKIDYLSLDADDSTYDAMERLIPFFKFNVITVEHDLYRVGPECQKKIYEFLTTFDYRREVKDVLAPETPGMPWSKQPFEDWYIHESIIR